MVPDRSVEGAKEVSAGRNEEEHVAARA